MSDKPVRPSAPLLTELDARELLAKPLLALCSEHGPTRVGKTLGLDEKTIRNARDEKSTLGLDSAINLLTLDPQALDGLLNHYGLRSVPIGSICDTDAGRGHESKVLHAALALSLALADDDKITVREIAAQKDTLIAARDALDELLNRLVARVAA